MRTCLCLFFVIVSVVGVTGCATQPAVEVYVTDLRPLPSTLFEQRLQLDLRIQNLTDKPIQASGMNVRLELNDRQWGRGVSAESLQIPALGEGRASVAVSSGVFDTVRQLLAMQGRETFSFGLSGRLIMPGLDKRFRRGGEISRADLESLGRTTKATSN